MNEFDEELAASVTATASFGASSVAERVARRRRRRRGVGVAVGSLVLAVGVGSLVAFFGSDDEANVEVADPPTTLPGDLDGPGELGPVVEDPVGAAGVAGELSDLHVESTDTFGFVECGAEGEPGPPTGDRAVELEALIDELRASGLHDQAFVVSSGGPQSIWGVLSVGLSSRYEPTLRWVADRVDPADVCVEFPEFGVRNLPPELAPVRIEVDSEAGEVTVTAEGCAPKGEWVQPFIRNRTGSAEVGIAIGRGGLAFTDDCPSPTPHVFELLNKAAVTITAQPGTLVFDGAGESGGSVGLSFDLVNAGSATMGDDLIAQHADDPTVQFQVSDIFGDSPVAGAVGEVATDQWPITGTGTIVVPPGVPAGTYHVRMIDAPELNGVLAVGSDVEIVADTPAGPDSGWILPDLNRDGTPELADLDTGDVYVSEGGEYRLLLDDDGSTIRVPVDGDESFTCSPDLNTVVLWDPIEAEGFMSLSELTVSERAAAWIPSVADLIGGADLPTPGTDCVAFG